MSAEQPIPKQRSRRWLIGLGAVVLLAALFWALDGWLLFRLNVIASDAFNTHPQAPVLVAADQEELAAYTPARLAKFLAAPSSRVRAIVCLSLAERREPKEPAAWAGVVPQLLVLADDRDETLRECAGRAIGGRAIGGVQAIPAEDADAAFAFAKRSDHSNPLRRETVVILLGKTLASNPDYLPQYVAHYHGLLSAADVETRRTAFDELASHASTAQETVAAFRELMKTGDPNGIARRHAGTMFRVRPELIGECLSGNEMQRMTVFDVAITPSTPAPLRSQLLAAPHLEQLQAVAGPLLAPEAPLASKQKGLDFLRIRPGGVPLLIEAVQKTRGRARAIAIGQIGRRLREHPNEAPALQTPILLSWMRDEDPSVHLTLFSFLSGPEFLAQRTGVDAPIVVACRQLLDERLRRSKGLDRRCFTFILQSAPMPRTDDIDRISHAAHAELMAIERKYAANKESTSSEAASEWGAWLDAHPEHHNRPAVKQFLDKRAELKNKGVLQQL